VIAAAVAAVALTRGPVAESVTQRRAIISFSTASPDHAFVILQNGARVDAGTGVDHVARLTRLTPGMHYTYTVRAGSGVLARGTFRAAPARAGRFTFAVVGDLLVERVSHHRGAFFPGLGLAGGPAQRLLAIAKVRRPQFFKGECHFLGGVHQSQQRFFLEQLSKAAGGEDWPTGGEVFIKARRTAGIGGL